MKKIWFMMFILMLPYALCEYPAWTDSMDAKSEKDPLYIEMDDSLPSYMPAKAKIFINDPLIRKEANYIEVFASNAVAYTLSGEEIVIDPSGTFRQALPYNGESVLEIGFRAEGGVGAKSSFSVDFYNVKIVGGREWPDTKKNGTELYQYNCNIETNRLLCKEKEGCMVCSTTLGSARKEFVISGSKYGISLPGRFDFKRYSDTDKSLQERSNFERFTYSEEKTMTYSSGSTMDISDSYTLEFDMHSSEMDAMQWGDYNDRFYKSQGYTKGTCDEKICEFIDRDVKKGGDWEPVSVRYFAYVNYPGKGVLNVKASRATGMENGGGDGEADAVLSEARKFAESYTQSPGNAVQKKGLRNTYAVRGNMQPETTDMYIWGTISDADANPMPFVQLIVKAKDEKFTGTTDANGDFQMPLAGIELKEGEELTALFAVDFRYQRDGKTYFVINDLSGNSYNEVALGRNIKIKGGENLEVHLRIDGSNDPDVITTVSSMDRLKHLSVIYYHMHEAVDFALTVLKANIDYKLPVDVFVGNTEGKTHYDMTDSKILISANVASYDAKDRPKNREYHEFAHHIMYTEYGGDFATGRSDPKSVPHEGYLNPNTGDSWTEGFAEFIAIAAAKESGDKTPEMYSYWGSLEANNYKMWDAQGKYEEFAVASLLWDMYDSTNEKGDALTLTLDEIWSIIRVKRADVFAYYSAFKSAYPRKSKEIDDLFVLHGVFADTTPGNHKLDRNEPWKWTNRQARQYIFVDLASNDSAKIEWKNGMVIGKATNYERANRTSAVRHDSAYLKVDDRVDFYLVKVHYTDNSFQDYEYTVDQREGKIYLTPMPSDSSAVITVVPDSVDYIGEAYTAGASELNSMIFSAEDEFFDTHDFKLKATGNHKDARYELYGGVKPDYSYEGDLGTKVPLKAVQKEMTAPKAAGKFPWFALVLAVALGGFGYLFARKEGFRKKVISGTKTGVVAFRKHGVPFIKKAAKKTAEITVKAGKAAVLGTKKGIEMIKPHVKKLKERIRKK
ncbi:MAG: carboxypeptidase regulatory-like domain-containing protein [Nanoarchaeota archaeon]|nr:carboxypeptidase regulatory-like domain-containing protein [Nanoarchaeota archaeon]